MNPHLITDTLLQTVRSPNYSHLYGRTKTDQTAYLLHKVAHLRVLLKFFNLTKSLF